MSIGQHLDNIESMVTSGRVRGTARTLVNIEAMTEALNEARGSMPDYIKEAEGRPQAKGSHPQTGRVGSAPNPDLRR